MDVELKGTVTVRPLTWNDADLKAAASWKPDEGHHVGRAILRNGQVGW